VLVALVITAHHAVAVLVERRAQVDVRKDVELVEVRGNQFAERVVPWALPDALARRLAALALGLGREIGAPGAA
jgi:hypothetical protein